MKKIKLILAGLLIVPTLAVATVGAGDVYAQSITDAVGPGGQAQGEGQPEGATLSGETVTRVINIMLYAVGIISVVMLIWGGIRYATSAGDSAKVTAAKNTVMYAVIGLVVAIFAFAIVNFVLTAANN